MYTNRSTPLRTPGLLEERYTLVQSRTRTIVERTFDVMVRRFPYFDVNRAMAIACAVLHNLCKKWREETEAVEEASEVDSRDKDETPEI